MLSTCNSGLLASVCSNFFVTIVIIVLFVPLGFCSPFWVVGVKFNTVFFSGMIWLRWSPIVEVNWRSICPIPICIFVICVETNPGLMRSRRRYTCSWESWKGLWFLKNFFKICFVEFNLFSTSAKFDYYKRLKIKISKKPSGWGFRAFR